MSCVTLSAEKYLQYLLDTEPKSNYSISTELQYVQGVIGQTFIAVFFAETQLDSSVDILLPLSSCRICRRHGYF